MEVNFEGWYVITIEPLAKFFPELNSNQIARIRHEVAIDVLEARVSEVEFAKTHNYAELVERLILLKSERKKL